MNRDRVAAALLAPAIAFAFVVGAIGLHRWFGIARVAITLAVVIWIVAVDTTRREWLPGAPRATRGWLRLGATGLLGVEIGRICVLIAKDGFAAGDAVAILIDLVVFGYLLQGALVELGRTPGGAIYQAAWRARATDPAKALRLATRATKLYRKWDDAWLLRALIAGQQAGQPEQVLVLRQGLRYCPRSKDLRDLLISSLYATGANDEAERALAEYRDMFPRSARPVLLDAANAVSAGNWEAARAHLTDAIERSRKERDNDALIKVARISRLMPDADTLARDAIQTAWRLDPSDRRLQVLLAILIENDEPARAVSLLDQARESWRSTGRTETFDELVAAERRYLDPNAPA